MKTSTCPHCGKAINAGSLLAAKTAGVKREHSEAEKQRRRERLAELRKKRWPKKGEA